jgi:DNA-binding beta-propeller fold protein YncE
MTKANLRKLNKTGKIKRNASSKKGVQFKALWLFAIVGSLVLLEVAFFIKNQMAVPKQYPMQIVSSFSGDAQSCGVFHAWDLTAGKDFIAVSDQSNNRILIFNLQGIYQKQITQKDAGAPDFKELSGITSDAQDHVYVIDTWNGMVRGFDLNGHPIVKASLQGSYGPRGVAWDNGVFMVGDTGTHRVVKLGMDGTTLNAWGKQGSGQVMFYNPTLIAVDAQGFIYVADTDNHRVQCLDPQGHFVRNYEVGVTVGNVAVNSEGQVFASTSSGDFCKVFEKNGKLLGILGDADKKGQPITGLKALAFLPDGDLLASQGPQILVLHAVPPNQVH